MEHNLAGHVGLGHRSVGLGGSHGGGHGRHLLALLSQSDLVGQEPKTLVLQVGLLDGEGQSIVDDGGGGGRGTVAAAG